ncbi:MAG: methyltransferase domain-containing protein [Saccharofermentanales bacterium]
MLNPFLEIPLEIYEKHMSLDSVYQLQTLNEIMRDQLNCYDVSTSMILGIAGGNGLEHVDIGKIDVVYGVDINSKYLKTCRQRYSFLGNRFKEICTDLAELTACLPKAELIIADLFIEYIGYEAFICHMQRINPKYISVVIQINPDDEFVSDSPYLHTFDRVAEVHHQIYENELKQSLDRIGYSCILNKEYSLPNGKLFQRFDFKSDSSFVE